MYKFLLTILIFISSIPTTNAQNLSDQLKQLARSGGFHIYGLDQLDTTPARHANGSLLQQIRTLLEKFNYVIVHGSKQKIQRLIVVGPKQSLPLTPLPVTINPPTNIPPSVTPLAPLTTGQEGEITISTKRDNSHHLVNATLTGENGQHLTQELLIDTGASLTVIPVKAALALGFTLKQLPTKTMQTLKGSLQVRIATLPILELGNIRVQNLNVAIAENGNLGNRGLLGMNLLSRYLFILDDERNELTLIPDPH